jgi:excisionase family DNA binding protein
LSRVVDEWDMVWYADRMSFEERLPHLLTPLQAANLFRVHRNTVYSWIAKERLPAFKAGGCWRIKREDVIDIYRGRFNDPLHTSQERGEQRGTGLAVSGSG